jgi:hypothetical protein
MDYVQCGRFQSAVHSLRWDYISKDTRCPRLDLEFQLLDLWLREFPTRHLFHSGTVLYLGSCPCQISMKNTILLSDQGFLSRPKPFLFLRIMTPAGTWLPQLPILGIAFSTSDRPPFCWAEWDLAWFMAITTVLRLHVLLEDLDGAELSAHAAALVRHLLWRALLLHLPHPRRVDLS